MNRTSSRLLQRLWDYRNVPRDGRLRQEVLKAAFEGRLA